MTAAPVQSRTQAQRREETIARLLDATIASLSGRGYLKTTTTRVCLDARLSQGALFRHFPTRIALIAAATEEVCRRHVELLRATLQALRVGSDGDPVAAIVLAMRSQARSAEHAAWHEVMVAARCDEELHDEVAATLSNFEVVLLATIEEALVQQFADVREKCRRLGMIMLSLMHLFDSEAVTTAVYRNEAIEAERLVWLTETLRRELGE